jgi:glycosyltransferase involved in cell wall biosynthesis
MYFPQISVITVTLNAFECLEKTLRSVVEQTYQNIQLIVLDGGSNDGTIEIIHRYSSKIAFWQSQKDKGIYDAMNLGIDKSSGDWVIFLNAGDFFHDSKILERVFGKDLHKDAEVLFGNVESQYDGFVVHNKARPLKGIWMGMPFSHQSVFIRTNYHKVQKFDLNFRFAADFDFFYSAYISGKKFQYLDFTISGVDVVGVSSRNSYQSILERWKVLRKYQTNSLVVYSYYSYLLAKEILKRFIHHRIMNKIRELRFS